VPVLVTNAKKLKDGKNAAGFVPCFLGDQVTLGRLYPFSQLIPTDSAMSDDDAE